MSPSQATILFAGGCHVVGYPVGSEHAFPYAVVRSLESSGSRCVAQTLPYIALHHPEKVVEACRRVRPDVLVLQLGNYELGIEISQYLLSRLGRKPRKRPSSPTKPLPAGEMHRYTLRSRVKQWIDRALGHPLVDFAAFAAQYDAFLDAVTASAPQVVIVSPTPCADPCSHYYRVRASAIAGAAAERRHWAYVDLTHLCPGPEEQRLGRDRFFADAMHMGIAGQAAAARCIAIRVKEVLERAPSKV